MNAYSAVLQIFSGQWTVVTVDGVLCLQLCAFLASQLNCPLANIVSTILRHAMEA